MTTQARSDVLAYAAAVAAFARAQDRLVLLDALYAYRANTEEPDENNNEICTMLEKQQDLEERYNELLRQRSAARVAGNKSKLREVEAELQQLAHAFRRSTKVLSRTLKDNPNKADHVRRVHRVGQELLAQLSSAKRELEAMEFCEALASQVTREREMRDKFVRSLAREKQVLKELNEVKAELKAKQENHAQLVAGKGEEIVALKEELRRLKSQCSEVTVYAARTATAASRSKQRLLHQEEEALQKEIAQIEKDMEIAASVHKETTAFLERNDDALSRQLDEWNNRYERDLEAVNQDLEALSAEREEHLAILAEKKQEYDTIIAERERKEAEERARQEQLQLEEERRKIMTASSVKIQACIRGFLTRKQLQAEAASKAKGKKKGKAKAKGGKKGKKPKK